MLCQSTSLQTTIKHDTDTGINIHYAKLILLLKEVKVANYNFELYNQDETKAKSKSSLLIHNHFDNDNHILHPFTIIVTKRYFTGYRKIYTKTPKSWFSETSLMSKSKKPSRGKKLFLIKSIG